MNHIFDHSTTITMPLPPKKRIILQTDMQKKISFHTPKLGIQEAEHSAIDKVMFNLSRCRYAMLIRSVTFYA